MIVALLAAVGLIGFYTWGTPGITHSHKSEVIFNLPWESQPRSAKKRLSYLQEKINLSGQFQYASRAIRTEEYDGERPDVTVMDESLFPELQTLDKSKLSDVAVTQFPLLTLRVPASPTVSTSVLSFGIATSIGRLNLSLNQLVHWLPDSGSPLHVISPPVQEGFSLLADVLKLTKDLNIDLHIHFSNASFPIAYFSLLKQLYDTRTPETRWLVLMDDDTFVPSLPSLVQHLNSNYDATKQTIVAAMSEDIFQIRDWGLIPYGGGGIFISVPLAARLTAPGIWDECVEGLGETQGDQILAHCLYSYTNVRPIFDPFLNQMDFRPKDESTKESAADGIFESGRRMLTVHHWRSWFDVDVPISGLVSQACGYEGIWQRWMFPRENLVLSNGYSITEYHSGVDKVNFDAVELTWNGQKHQFWASIGPLRPPLGDDEKRTLRMVHAEVVQGLGVRQLYYKKGAEREGSLRDMDQVLELLWLV